jgi:beta-lactam-binding protein with PASTA domain
LARYSGISGISKVYVKTGRAIGLRLSKKSELVEMPTLVHKQIQLAESILEQRSLRYEIRYRSTSEENGQYERFGRYDSRCF